MRQARDRVTRRTWLGSLLLVMIFASSSVGCLHTRGAMYLGKRRVGVYLEKTRGQQPPKGVDFATYVSWRQRMAEMPDGNRILGGFCTDPAVQPVLRAIDGLRPRCQQHLHYEATTSNTQGKLFWAFLGTTLGAGAGAFVFAGGAFAATGEDTKTALGITSAVFGSVALLGALINGFGGFDARQERHELRANRVDNFMWSLRQRVIVEVCNAKSRATAVQQVVYIYRMSQRYCSDPQGGDGVYRPPSGGARFDSKTLPGAPTPATPRTVEPPPPGSDQQPAPSQDQPDEPAQDTPPADRNGDRQPTPRDRGQQPTPRDKAPGKSAPGKPAPSKPAPSKPAPRESGSDSQDQQ